MATITGVELGTDSCLLIRARRRENVTELSALHAMEGGDWPPQDDAQAALLRRIRREQGFPRRARVVAWHLPASASLSDPATRAILGPLIAAGFRIEALVSPPRALAILAASRPRATGAAAAWLGLNRHGAAIAIVRGSELLFSREFDWSYRDSTASPNAQLLQRYSLVAHLAPELRRGIDIVKAGHSVRVEAAITCGDLPDLRSLTMPLIEELDLEVETLDSTEGLTIAGPARTQRVVELAPALRLATAAAIGAQPERSAIAPIWLRAAAAVVVLAGAGWVWYASRPAPPPVSHDARSSAGQAATKTPGSGRGTASPRPSATPKSAVRPAPGQETPSTGSLGGSTRAPATASRATPAPSTPSRIGVPGGTKSQQPPRGAAQPAGQHVPAKTEPAVAGTPSPKPTTPGAAVPKPAAQPGPRASAQPIENKPPSVPRAVPRPASPSPAPVRPRTGPATEAARPKAGSATAVTQVATPKDAAPKAAPGPRPLNVPVPAVTSILISADRRLAVIDGRIVGVGDAVGPRVVARIDQTAVLLREPSGFELRVPLR